jgi:hypothetical protein
MWRGLFFDVGNPRDDLEPVSFYKQSNRENAGMDYWKLRNQKLVW